MRRCISLTQTRKSLEAAGNSSASYLYNGCQHLYAIAFRPWVSYFVSQKPLIYTLLTARHAKNTLTRDGIFARILTVIFGGKIEKAVAFPAIPGFAALHETARSILAHQFRSEDDDFPCLSRMQEPLALLDNGDQDELSRFIGENLRWQLKALLNLYDAILRRRSHVSTRGRPLDPNDRDALGWLSLYLIVLWQAWNHRQSRLESGVKHFRLTAIQQNRHADQARSRMGSFPRSDDAATSQEYPSDCAYPSIDFTSSEQD